MVIIYMKHSSEPLLAKLQSEFYQDELNGNTTDSGSMYIVELGLVEKQKHYEDTTMKHCPKIPTKTRFFLCSKKTKRKTKNNNKNRQRKYRLGTTC